MFGKDPNDLGLSGSVAASIAGKRYDVKYGYDTYDAYKFEHIHVLQ